MMAAVFAALLLAFTLELIGWQRAAVCSLVLSLALGVWLFLWEIYSPDYGFRMPWLQVELQRDHQLEAMPISATAGVLRRPC